MKTFGARARLLAYSAIAVLVLAGAVALGRFAAARAHDASLLIVPVPSSAVAAAPLAGGLVAVLAGDERTKAVYVIDMFRKTTVASFGVPREVTGIAATSDQGPLLLSVGAEGSGRAGTIERWTIDGTKTGTLALPGPGLAVTAAIGDTAYALVGTGTSRAAIPIDVRRLAAKKAVPLPSAVERLAQCEFADGTFLAYSTADHHIGMRSTASPLHIESTARAEAPTCVAGKSAVLAISPSAGAAAAVVLALPRLNQVAALPLANTAVSLYDAGDGRLGSVNSTRNVGTISILPASALDVGAIESAVR